MTAIAFAFLLVIAALVALRFPFVGVAVYLWLDLFAAFSSFAGSSPLLPFSQILAICTIIGCVMQFTKLKLQFSLVMLLLVLYASWITLTTYSAVFQETAWEKWDRPIKTLLMISFLVPLVDKRQKLEVLVFALVSAISLSALQGVTSLLRGYGADLDGASGDLLGGALDRNFLSARFVGALPLCMILFTASSLMLGRLTRPLAVGVGLVLLLGIVASFSRGATLGILSMFLVAGLVSNRRSYVAVIAIAIAISVVTLAPEAWTQRIMGIGEGSQTNESSAVSRMQSWKFAWDYTVDHPLLGGGFTIYRLNISPFTNLPIDIHSFLFELLAEQGFVGTSFYLGAVLVSLFICARLYLRNKKYPNERWIANYALAFALSLIGVFTAGLFINMANQVLPFYLMAMVVGLKQLETKKIGFSNGETEKRSRQMPPIRNTRKII